jgi:hypothetical protein
MLSRGIFIPVFPRTLEGNAGGVAYNPEVFVLALIIPGAIAAPEIPNILFFRNERRLSVLIA